MMTLATRIARKWAAIQNHREEWLSHIFSPAFDPSKLPTKFAGKMDFQAVFMVGSAGSGKGFTKERLYLKNTGFVDIDSDEIKKTHPEYDPDNVKQHVHDWSTIMQEQQFDRVIQTGAPFVFDGTGANTGRMRRLMAAAERAGYRTFATYVYAPLEVCLYRNRSRGRFVRESVVIEKFYEVKESWPKIKLVADKSKVVINFTPAQLELAKRNLAVYPGPYDKRPPIVD